MLLKLKAQTEANYNARQKELVIDQNRVNDLHTELWGLVFARFRSQGPPSGEEEEPWKRGWFLPRPQVMTILLGKSRGSQNINIASTLNGESEEGVQK